MFLKGGQTGRMNLKNTMNGRERPTTSLLREHEMTRPWDLASNFVAVLVAIDASCWVPALLPRQIQGQLVNNPSDFVSSYIIEFLSSIKKHIKVAVIG